MPTATDTLRDCPWLSRLSTLYGFGSDMASPFGGKCSYGRNSSSYGPSLRSLIAYIKSALCFFSSMSGHYDIEAASGSYAHCCEAKLRGPGIQQRRQRQISTENTPHTLTTQRISKREVLRYVQGNSFIQDLCCLSMSIYVCVSRTLYMSSRGHCLVVLPQYSKHPLSPYLERKIWVKVDFVEPRLISANQSMIRAARSGIRITPCKCISSAPAAYQAPDHSEQSNQAYGIS